MSDHYILDEAGNPVAADLMTWARWFEDIAKRQLARTDLPDGGFVSTVFLGLDHGFGRGAPVLWESLAFDAEGSSCEETMRRYTSREEALMGHAEVVALFTDPAPPPEPSEEGG